MHSKILVGLTILAVVLSEGKFCASEGYWPQTETFREATVNCDSGSLSRMCMGDQEWGRIDDHDCQCVPNDEVPVLQNVARGETIQHQCDRGFIEVTCNMTGTWDMNDIISNDCFCARNDGFSMTETENYASKKCTLGEAERLCNFGKWDAPDYGNCFNYQHQCSSETTQSVMFFVSPSSGHKDVEVCILPVLRDVEKTVDDIKTLGQCTKETDNNGQFVFSFELEAKEYTALVYAHSDHSFVSIPALSHMLSGNHYEFLFTMQSCDNTISFASSDSYSITIDSRYVWAATAAPSVTVYYTSDMSLKLKDISDFNKKTFRGVQGLGRHQFHITGLTPYTQYQFYVFIEAQSGSYYVRPLISNRVIGMTYKTCIDTDGMWSEVGVGDEATIGCAVGFHAYYCAKLENYEAAFTTRRDPCYCPEEEMNGWVYPQTQYGETAPSPQGKRVCGWEGVWERVPSIDCEADGEWPAVLDGTVVVKKCENDGQIIRRCNYGVWMEPENQNCGCPQVVFEEVEWGAENVGGMYTHQCGLGTMTRRCNEWGWWETPEAQDCRCATEGEWLERPHNTVQEKPCGTEGTPGNVATRRCRNNGFWADDIDYSTCMCDSHPLDEVIWPSTEVDTAAWVQCEIGSKARICLFGGFWDMTVANYNCACAADMDWEQTLAGETISLPCPDDADKSQTRRCRGDGVWAPVDATGCYGSCPTYGRFPVTLSGTTSYLPCDEGEGRVAMDCLRKVDANGDFYGEWDLSSWRVEGECKCAADDAFPAATAGSESVVECDSGSRTRVCGKFTARWEEPVNHDCACTVAETSLAALTPLFEYATVACGEGSRNVYCAADGHFENIADAECFCSAADGFGKTHAGEMSTARCAEAGTRTRVCPTSGFWMGVDYSECRCTPLPGLIPLLSPTQNSTYECDLGRYAYSCDEQGHTVEVEKSCRCPAVGTFPEKPAGTDFREACGTKMKSGVCTITGVWEDLEDNCFCDDTEEFPEISFGAVGEAKLPQCYVGYCDPVTEKTTVDYAGCGCAAMDEWPAIAHNETKRLSCDGGGYREASCYMGVLSVEYEDCGCTAEDGTEVAVGDYQSFPCMMGFILKQCRGNNFWYSVADSYCGCASSDDDLNAFEFMRANETKTVSCGAGTMSITCGPTGHFDMSSWVKECRCPTESLWPETAANEMATIQCDGSSQVVQRSCGEMGEWGATSEACSCPENGEWAAGPAGHYNKTCADSGIKIYRTCNDDGTWSPATGSCLDNSCPEDGVFPITPHLGSYTYTCGNGAQVTRTCTAGQWSTADWSMCGCADDQGFSSGEYIDSNVYSLIASLPCGDGERTRECRYGVWEEINYNNCFCGAMGVLPRTPANEDAIHTCPVGVVSAHCNAVGVWEVLSDSCGCAEDSEAVEGITFPATMSGMTARADCLSGYMERRCAADGTWEAVDYSQCQCVAEGWTSALPTEEGRMDCEEGYLTRMCKPNGQWGVISSNACACAKNDLFERTIVSQVAQHDCDSGYVLANCTMNGWSEEENHGCACRTHGEYTQTLRDTYAEVPCGERRDGFKRRMCLHTGHWESEDDESFCVDYCPALGEWDFTKPDTTATLPCPEGYSKGEITRHCNSQGRWEVGVSTCVPEYCKPEGVFPATAVNSFASVPCDPGYAGEKTRMCNLVNGEGVWDNHIEDNCTEVFCKEGGFEYKHDEEITRACPEGHIGGRMLRCDTGVMKELSSTCTPVVCPANPEEGVPEGVFGDVHRTSCGADYQGVVEKHCNAFQQWERVSEDCQLVAPMLRCEPVDGAVDVSLSSAVDEQYTIVCTSSVRIASVINDHLENMNVFLVFETASATINYSTETVFISDYTVAFKFDGSLPPAKEGSLYVNAESFVSRQDVKFPASTIVQTFTTRAGTPLPPAPVPVDSSVQIMSIDYAHRTASLKLTMPFDEELYEEGEVAFIGSNLQSVRFVGTSVTVEGAILNSILSVSWRVRLGEHWSAFAGLAYYRPMALLPPAQPEVAYYNAQVIRWSWSGAELFGQTFSHYAWTLLKDGEVFQSGVCSDAVLEMTLEAGFSYALRVAVCTAEECSIDSAVSVATRLVSTVVAPSKPQNFMTAAVGTNKVRLAWTAPAEFGGASILSYRIRRSSHQTMLPIEKEYEVSGFELILNDVTAKTYFEVAAFNGYVSTAERETVEPVALQAQWSDNMKEGVKLDNAIVIYASFNYACSAVCDVTTAAHPTFHRTMTLAAGLQVESTLLPLTPDTTYTFVCTAYEVGSDASVSAEFSVKTAASAELEPVLMVDGAPTTSVTATATVTANMLGLLTCVVTPYTGAADRPSTGSIFSSNWAQSVEVTRVNTPVMMLFASDAYGAPLNPDITYHAWCMLEREVLQYDAEQEVKRILVFPEYAQSRRRQVLQESVLEVVEILPAEFSEVDPSSSVHIRFSMPVVQGEGKVTLLNSNNEEIVVGADRVHCVRENCEISFEGGLRPNQRYLLNVEDNAFVNGATPLERGVENYIFMTGPQRCDTKYVSKGLWNSRMCQCFSVEGKCECECGETYVMRSL